MADKNAEIAKALGWVWVDEHSGDDTGTWHNLGWKRGRWSDPDPDAANFDTNPVTALRLVEEMEKRDLLVSLNNHRAGGWTGVVLRINRGGEGPSLRVASSVEAPTFPLAIRDAAHAALCGDQAQQASSSK